MNLFILDKDPQIAATYYNDSHVRKIILEATIMMGYAYYYARDDILKEELLKFEPLPWLFTTKGGLRHLNHPMSKWVRNSISNFLWTLDHTQALCEEYSYRKYHLATHAYTYHIDWIRNHVPKQNFSSINTSLTDWPRCFGDFKYVIPTTDDIVADYRKYYILANKHLAKWTRREIPSWYNTI